MQIFLQILQFTLPSVVLLIAVWLILKMFFRRDEENRRAQLEASDRKELLKLKSANAGVITPIRLQAYERIILLLERITPDNLIMRLRRTNISAGEMQGILLKSIRDEYDHNMSQQLYVSEDAWELVKKSKEEIIQLINNTGAALKEDSNGIDLCRKILENASQIEKFPTIMAMQAIKSEVRKLF